MRPRTRQFTILRMMGLVAFAGVFLAGFRTSPAIAFALAVVVGFALIRTIGMIDLVRSQGLRLGPAAVVMVFVWSLLVVTLIVVLSALVLGLTTYFAMAYAFIVDRAVRQMPRTGTGWSLVYYFLAATVGVVGRHVRRRVSAQAGPLALRCRGASQICLRSTGRHPLHRRAIT